MKRIWIVVATLAVAAAMAAPASAARPACPGNSCNSDPQETGMTCAEAESLGFEHVVPTWTSATSFDLVMSSDSACVDVYAGAGQWEIDITSVGSAKEVYVAVKDSVNPGDTCWGVSDVGSITEPSVFDPHLPAATLDACGSGEADGDDALAFVAWFRGGKVKQPVTLSVTFPPRGA